jgi:hypothetical protein
VVRFKSKNDILKSKVKEQKESIGELKRDKEYLEKQIALL